jgi:NADH:ubiquinone oxidoreductase subunit F (NADH-binding)
MIGAIHDKVCMVEASKYFLDFEEGLSCGKCVPCRIGLKRMHEGMQRIVDGTGTAEDLEQIKSLCKTMIDTPHCEFAMTSSRPVLSAITYFADEFTAHIERQECPAGVCKNLVEIQRKRAIRERLSGKKKK